MVNLNVIGVNLEKIFGGKKVSVATNALTTVVEKEIPKVVNGVKPSETIAFGLPKQLDKDYLFKLREDLYEHNNLINKLKLEGAPKELIEHVKTKSPLKYAPNASLSEQYSNPAFRNFLNGKVKDRQIQEFLKNKELKILERKDLLEKMERGHIDFSKTKITNPDEILELITSGKYIRNEREMFEMLSKTGTPAHAEKLLSEVEVLLPKTAEDAKNITLGVEKSLSNRVFTIGLIGNEKQKADLIAKLQRELRINKNREVTNEIFNGIGRIGKSQPENSKFAEILLNNTFGANQELAYKQLSNFNNQFYIITHGMKQNPESTKVLASAYISARTFEQKEILLNTILASQKLKETAIRSTTEFPTFAVLKDYKADILSKLTEKNSFNTLSDWAKSTLERHLNIS